MTSFTRKRLRFTFTLSQGTYDGKSNSLVIEGLRAVVGVQKGGVMMSTLQARVFGLKAQDMNSLTMIGWRPLAITKNTVKIEAGDATGYSEVFRGQIVNCWADYSTQPDVFLSIEAQSAYFEQIAPVTPRSYTGPTDVAIILQTIATSMGLGFENNGVTAQLASPYLAGTDLTQAQSVAKAAGINMDIDEGLMILTPKSGSRATAPVPVIDSASGLVSYPVQDKMGLSFHCLYTPKVRLSGLVQVARPGVDAASQWHVYALAHTLESEKPGGAWFSQVRCSEAYHGG